jgi:hypothetical protein
MEIRKFRDLNDWEIVNNCGGTRNGFKHESTLFHYGNEVENARVCYLNRTWECYTYQTSMREVVHKYTTKIKNRIVDDYKNENNVKRLTQKHKEKIEKLFAEDSRLVECAIIQEQLNYSR